MVMVKYKKCDRSDLPNGLVWHTPRVHQGQHIEVQYAEPGARDELIEGARYKRVINRSVGPHDITYYRRIEETGR
jgi:methylaspartate ammonia-lyase